MVSLIPRLSAHDKLAAARLMARERMPYFTAALLKMVPRATPGLGTLGVTAGAVLQYDPAVVDAWSIEELCTVLLHEVGHLVRDHFGRCKRGSYDPKLWNIAGDAEINDDLAAAGLRFPAGVAPVMPATLGCPDGLPAEHYYAHQQNQGEGGQDGSQGQEQGEGKPGKGGSGGKPGDRPQAGGGWCGSGAGRAHPDEPPTEDPDARSQSELDAMRQDVAQAVQAHASRGRGNLPAGLRRWADKVLTPPKVRWQDRLARVCRRAVAYRPGAVDYRYDRPSRRQPTLGYGAGKPLLPRMVQPVPRVAVAIDTSGSMGGAEMSAALREVRAILDATGASVDLCSCDAAVHGMGTVTSWEDAAKLLKGGGGTDFNPAFDALLSRNPRPEVLVFVTDGLGPAPERAPHGVQVIWLLLGKYRQRPCAWGDVIEIDD